MSQKPPHYDVWSDGSFRGDDSLWVGGGGWVIVHEEIQTEGSRSFTDIPKNDRNHGSDIAELRTIACALEAIPNGSSIRLRLDAQNILDALKTGNLKTSVPSVESAFQQALNSIKRMSKVEFIKVSDRNNDNIKRANVLARTAASPSKAGK